MLKQEKIEEKWTLLIAALAAFLLASHQVELFAYFGVLGSYIYWIGRLLIEASLFWAVLVVAERYLTGVCAHWVLVLGAIVVSLLPFALAVTTLDLVLGLPELGFNKEQSQQRAIARAFALELVSLADNHAALSLLLMLPRWILTQSKAIEGMNKQYTAQSKHDEDSAFFRSIDPPILGQIYRVEAQEHYVQVVSSDDTRMLLYRFSDVVKQLPDSLGLQVHRSHWVAYDAVEKLSFQGQSLKLLLKDDTQIPVSRTFKKRVESEFEDALSTPSVQPPQQS